MGDRELSAKSDGGDALESFEYPEIPGTRFVPSWSGWDVPEVGAAQREPADGAKRNAASAENTEQFERRLQEETRRSFEAGRTRGMEEGRKAERQAHEKTLAAEAEKKVAQYAALLEKFAKERERHFKEIELEVVRLAMAVAERILRREATSDPLLLMGSVRAALGQISAATEIRLRVPAAELDLWTAAIKLLPGTAVKPALLIGEGMVVGDCTIETALGTADLGIRAQLAEVERVLLDDPGRPAEKALRGEVTSAQAESAA